jgi:hypothetical protein
MVDLLRVRMSGALAPFADGFVVRLAAEGYTPHEVRRSSHP